MSLVFCKLSFAPEEKIALLFILLFSFQQESKWEPPLASLGFENAPKNHLFQSPLQQITPACVCMHAFSNVVVFVFKSVKEEVFWRNYFYRVSLIKQSAQLTALAAQQQAAGKEEKSHGREEELPLTGIFRGDVTVQKRVTLKIFLT